jgi:hypothetical protein
MASATGLVPGCRPPRKFISVARVLEYLISPVGKAFHEAGREW